MIIVTGWVRVAPGRVDEAIAVSLEHARRHQGFDRLVFLEHGADRPSLAAHFRVPASNDLVSALAALAAEPPSMAVYEAERTRV